MVATGSYTKVRNLGSGSYGKVMLVRHADGHELVMKSINAIQGEGNAPDALNEVRVLSALQHPFIVRYHESFLDGRSVCIVMDYEAGGDLYTRVTKTRNAGQRFPECQRSPLALFRIARFDRRCHRGSLNLPNW